MLKVKWVVSLAVAVLASGCAITDSGRGFDLVDDNEYAEALPHLEKAASEGSKSAALMAGLLYLTDYQIPRDIDKATHYYEKVQSLGYGRYDQFLDYFSPQLKARILLADPDKANDGEATSILRGERYSQYSPALRTLAQCYGFGIGVERNLQVSKHLYERAMEYDDRVYASRHYAWWLAVYPDARFRDGARAQLLMEAVMEDRDEKDRAVTLDTLAAVHAENGLFEEAEKIQARAVEKLGLEIENYPDFEKWHEAFECRLKYYRAGRPWRVSLKESPFIVPESWSCSI